MEGWFQFQRSTDWPQWFKDDPDFINTRTIVQDILDYGDSDLYIGIIEYVDLLKSNSSCNFQNTLPILQEIISAYFESDEYDGNAPDTTLSDALNEIQFSIQLSKNIIKSYEQPL